MLTVGVVARELSDYLVDQEPGYEFEHWTEENLLTYIRDALRILVLNFKGEFTTTRRLALQPGGRQALPRGCDSFVSVSAQVSKSGRVMSYLRRASSATIGVLGVAPCPAGKRGYRARTYQADSSDKRTFVIEPPVPEGEIVYADVQCVCPPDVSSFESELALPSYLIPILKELVLYYAYGTDQESVTARAYSETHWKNAAALIGAERALPAVNNIDTIKRE